MSQKPKKTFSIANEMKKRLIGLTTCTIPDQKEKNVHLNCKKAFICTCIVKGSPNISLFCTESLLYARIPFFIFHQDR